MIKIATSTEYRLPGVYSNEGTGPRLSVTVGGNATVAFVGEAVGSRAATQNMTLVDLEQVALVNNGVVTDSYDVRGNYTGINYVLNRDYIALQQADGETSIQRSLTTLPVAKTDVTGKKFTYYTAQPTFNILTDDDGNPISGHVIRGTVVVTGVADIAEGVDYEINYLTNEFIVKAVDTPKIVNGTELTFAYSYTQAEPVELRGEATYSLQSKYIARNGMTDEDGERTCIIVSCKQGEDFDYGDTPGAADGYIEGIDFVIDYDNNRIQRTASSRIPSFSEETLNYFYVSYAYCAIRSGESVNVSYRYRESSYYDAKFFGSYNELAKQYGNPWDTATGALVSPISMAAYIASRNGMSYCYAVAVETTVGIDGGVGTTLSAWDDALDKLTMIDGIDIVVPVSGDQEVWNRCREHIVKMKENQDERVAILGADGTETPYTSEQMIAFANGLSDEDLWLVSPSTFRFRNPITSIIETVPGYYAAAAIAGYNSTVPQYTPLTRKVISGLYAAAEYNTKMVKQNQCGNGLMYIDEQDASLRILHGRTTSTTSIIEQETNIVLTKHYIVKRARSAFSSGFIGSVITPDTLLEINAAIVNMLNSLYSASYISGYDGVSVEQDEVNQTQVNISFQYRPTYSLNYINIEFSIDSTVTV